MADFFGDDFFRDRKRKRFFDDEGFFSTDPFDDPLAPAPVQERWRRARIDEALSANFFNEDFFDDNLTPGDEPFTGTVHWRFIDKGDGSSRLLMLDARKLLSHMLQQREDGTTLGHIDKYKVLGDGRIIYVRIRDGIILIDIIVPEAAEEFLEERKDRFPGLWAGIKYIDTTVDDHEYNGASYGPNELPPLLCYIWEPVGGAETAIDGGEFPPWVIGGSDQHSFNTVTFNTGDSNPLYNSGNPVELLEDGLEYTIMPTESMTEFCTQFRYLRVDTDELQTASGGFGGGHFVSAENSQEEFTAGLNFGATDTVIRSPYGLYMCSYGYANDPTKMNEDYDQPGNPDFWQYTVHLNPNDPLKTFEVYNDFLNPKEGIGSWTHSIPFGAEGYPGEVSQPNAAVQGFQEWQCIGQILSGQYVLVVWPGKNDECAMYGSNEVLVRVRIGNPPGQAVEFEFTKIFEDTTEINSQYRQHFKENLPYGYYDNGSCNFWCPTILEGDTDWQTERCLPEDVDCVISTATFNGVNPLDPEKLIILIDVELANAHILGDDDDDPTEAELWPQFIKTTEYNFTGSTWQDQPFAEGSRTDLNCEGCQDADGNTGNSLFYPEPPDNAFTHAYNYLNIYAIVVAVDNQGQPCRVQIRNDLKTPRGPGSGAIINGGISGGGIEYFKQRRLAFPLYNHAEVGEVVWITGNAASFSIQFVKLTDPFYLDVTASTAVPVAPGEESFYWKKLESYHVIGDELHGWVPDRTKFAAGVLGQTSETTEWRVENGAWQLFFK